MPLIIRPYLIQSAVQRVDGNLNGIDALLHFNYMGAAEFENGVLARSFARIRKQRGDYKLMTWRLLGDRKLMVSAFIHNDLVNVVGDIIEELALDKYRLLERIKFSDWTKSKSLQSGMTPENFWIDVQHDYCWWPTGDGQFGKQLVSALCETPKLKIEELEA